MDRKLFRFYTSNVEAVIQDNGNTLMISDFRFDRWYYRDGDPDNCSCSVYVKSGFFTGMGILRFNINDFQCFINELRGIDVLTRTSSSLFDPYDDEKCIEFQANKLGKIQIKGYFTDTADEFALRFTMETDITVIRPFQQQLEQMIKNLKL